MECTETDIAGVLIIKPDIYEDERGFFTETYSKKKYEDLGLKENFVQDNYSYSTKGTLRGLHYQLKNPQAKLVRVLQGEVFDVAADIRQGSPTFGHYFSINLNDSNLYQLYIPEGIAHGFYVLSDSVRFEYKCSEYYYSEDQQGVSWNDETLDIDWPLVDEPLVSLQDSSFLKLQEKGNSDLPFF